MNNLFILVILMAIVTYIPRLLPMVFLKDMKLPPYLKVFLQFIPYATLGALIFPGIVISTGDIYSALVGGGFAVILSLYKANVMLVVTGGIVGAYTVMMLM